VKEGVEVETEFVSPEKTQSALQLLEAIEGSIALTDRQRLLVLQTTDLAVTTVLREQWPEIRKSCDVTVMIARRMFNHYSFQKQLKKDISLSTISSASGVFHQVVGTYLRAYLRSRDDSFRVALEKSYGTVRPDISIEKNGKPWAALEVKTDLGWNRPYLSSGEWTKRRQSVIDAGFRDARLVLLANSNWSGWDTSMEPLGVL
jgi:capsid protein